MTIKETLSQTSPLSKRQLEVIGIFVILIGIFFSLSVLSYHPLDYPLIREIGFSKLLGLGEPPVRQVYNWMGLLGAVTGHFLIQNVLGYPVIILCASAFIWGWVLIRHHDVRKPVYFTIYSIIFSLLLAGFLGFISTITEAGNPGQIWAGIVGLFIGSFIHGLLGSIGGFIIFIFSILLSVTLFFDMDYRLTAKRFQLVIERFAGRVLSRKEKSLPPNVGNENEQIEKKDEPSIEPEISYFSDDEQNEPYIEESEPVRPGKRVGIPLSEILPEQAVRDEGSVETDRPDSLPQAPVVIEPERFKGDDDDFIPVSKSESEIPNQNPSDWDSGEQKEPLKRSDHLSDYLRQKIRESEQSEPKSLETEFIPINIPPDDEKIPVVEELPIENPEGDVPDNPGNIHIDLEVNPIVSETKAEKPRDPIFKYGYRFPGFDLLTPTAEAERLENVIRQSELEENAIKLVNKLKTYGIEVVDKPKVTVGPSVTLYEIVPAEGIKVSRITALADDIALAMAAKGIRIMAPIPGKSAVGVEIPNKNPVIVRLREILESQKFQDSREKNLILPVAFGRTINNSIYVEDLTKLPHLLVAGTTGSGKSVGINTIINSLLYYAHPSTVKFVMIDPKKIELSPYRRLEKHYLAVLPELDEPILTDTSKAVILLKSVEKEMDDRYTLLANVGVRHLSEFNKKVEMGTIAQQSGDPYVKLPYIVVIIDELADLMITSGREVEEPIARIAQLARAVGIHLVVATQRPSVDVITGMIKANFPARIAYQVASKIDSRTILDMNGAEQLLGYGDMLYLPGSSPKPVRIQNAFISTEEVESVISYISKQPGFVSAYKLPSPPDSNKGGGKRADQFDDEWDDFMEEAAQVVVQYQQGSTSLLQRKLRIGYSRAARIIDQLEHLGIVGPPDGSKAREVLIEDTETLKEIFRNQ